MIDVVDAAVAALSDAATAEFLQDFRTRLGEFLKESPVVNGSEDGAVLAFCKMVTLQQLGVESVEGLGPCGVFAFNHMLPLVMMLARSNMELLRIGSKFNKEGLNAQ